MQHGYYRIDQVAAWINRPIPEVYALIAEGTLTAVKCGRVKRVDESSIRAYFAAVEARAAEPTAVPVVLDSAAPRSLAAEPNPSPASGPRRIRVALPPRTGASCGVRVPLGAAPRLEGHSASGA